MAVTPDDRNSVVITKQFTYRGATKRFSNRYHFEGAVPANDAAWTTLCDNIVTAEKAIYPDTVEIVQASGYDSGTATSTNPHGDAVFTKLYTTVGTGDFSSAGFECPGDCAAFVRYGTPARTTKNHPVYLSNYYHGVYQELGEKDNIASSQLTALNAYTGAWLDGFTDGSSARVRCGPHGAVATSRRVDTVIRHRDFPV
jgi:hypothetical protein